MMLSVLSIIFVGIVLIFAIPNIQYYMNTYRFIQTYHVTRTQVCIVYIYIYTYFSLHIRYPFVVVVVVVVVLLGRTFPVIPY